MRNDPHDPRGKAPENARHVPGNEREFFESFFRASVEGEPTDRETIASVSEPEARFHYNAVENAILRAFMRRRPPPRGPALRAWRMIERRAARRLLDVGSATGHWIDFFRDVLYVAEAVGVEITERMSRFLERKYTGDPRVTILRADVADPDFTVERIGGPVDYVSAIGVMFHIVDDERWRTALANLAGVLAPGGLMFVGGDFGDETRDVQFHRVDRFESWREEATADAPSDEIRVNKRVRSLADWTAAAAAVGLAVADLIRAESEPTIATPENDLLVLARSGEASA